jgi:pimeloyl-ACP methyl ester carboxylesterase
MTLLVAHGLGRHAAEWIAAARGLSPDAIVPDLPELRVTDRKPDTAAVIAALLAELDRRRVADAIWLGHSGGAYVVLEAALAHPARVRRLVLVGAAPSRELLARVHCEVITVVGAADAVAVAAAAAPLARVRAIAIAGAAHDPHLEAAEAFVAQLRAALG